MRVPLPPLSHLRGHAELSPAGETEKEGVFQRAAEDAREAPVCLFVVDGLAEMVENLYWGWPVMA